MRTRTQTRTWTRTQISFFAVLTCFGKFCIALALYCYFMLIDPCCACYWILALILTEVLASEKDNTDMVGGWRRRKL